MLLSIRGIYLFIIILMGVFTPILTANFPPIVNAIFSKLCLVSLMPLMFALLLRVPQRRAILISRTPAFVFFCYLMVQSFLTISSANSSLRIAISNVMFVALFFSSFLIPALLSSDWNNKILAWIFDGLLLVASISVAIDLLGYGKWSAGSYGDRLPERLGFEQVHGLMPWPNALATYLLVFSLLLYIVKPSSKSAWFGFALILLTLVRGHAVSMIMIAIVSIKSRLVKVIIVGTVLVVAVSFLPKLVTQSAQELDVEENAGTIYRLVYIVNSYQALIDHPILGVGINRLTNATTWELDGFSLHERYRLPIEMFGLDMGTSDTGVTFFAEIGLAGIILYLIQLGHFVVLSFKLDCKKYALFVIPQVFLVYSFPSIILSVTFGTYYWFLYGNLVARYWEKINNVTSEVLVG